MVIQKEGERERELLKMSEISLSLDTYDDIFSDFDPRPYSQRALSDDFLLEIKRASRDKEDGSIELKFLIPAEQRNIQKETLIKKRLRDHFRHHHTDLAHEITKTKRRGVIMALCGVGMILIAAKLSEIDSNFIANLFRTILEPAGWFTGWVGMQDVYDIGKEISPDHDFYKKMEHAEITFWSY